MGNKVLHYIPLAVCVLLMAAALRLNKVGYGIENPCLTVPDEYWLWDTPQVSSLYSWNIRPVVDEIPIDPLLRTAVPNNDVWLALRFLGVFAGLITVAVIMRFALDRRSNWWLYAGLLCATFPTIVDADRWVTRFDLAVPVTAISLLCLLRLRRHPKSSVLLWIQTLTALSLLIVAPPLWWLVIGLIALQPKSDWRKIAFILVVMVTAIPALQSVDYWLPAATSWDIGITSTCILGLLALCLWHRPTIGRLFRGALVTAVIVAAAISLINIIQLPTPNADQWSLIQWLQARIPDGALVRFDPSTWTLTGVVACPQKNNLHFTAQPRPYATSFLPGYRPPAPEPDYIVTTDKSELADVAFVTNLNDKFFIGRTAKFQNPVDIEFGDILYLLNYQIANQQLKVGDPVNVRLDFQYAPSVTIDALRYGAFIHITKLDDPSAMIVNYNVPIMEESVVFGPRRIVSNEHHRLTIPLGTLPGKYRVFFGMYNFYTGEALSSVNGSMLPLGDIEVSAS